jgi:hypothetical protein
VKCVAGEQGPKLEPMQHQWYLRRSALEPAGEHFYIFSPIVEAHLFKDARALADSTIVISQDFYSFSS